MTDSDNPEKADEPTRVAPGQKKHESPTGAGLTPEDASTQEGSGLNLVNRPGHSFGSVEPLGVTETVHADGRL
jgi:hypothetical protein